MQGIEAFLKRYEALGQHEADENELNAGVDKLSVFGHFGTIVQLSRKMGQTYEYVSQMPADEVYMTLLYDMEVNEYEKRYSDIMKKVSQVK